MDEAQETEVITEKSTTVEQSPVETQQDSTDDLLSRVTKFEKTATTEETQDNIDETFDASTITNIEDPQARKYAEDAHKELEKAYQKKFRELAEIKKNVEPDQTSSSWTTDSVQKLLDDPTFVQAANSLANPVQDEEYSALSDAEKGKMKELEKQVQLLQMQNSQATKTQQDEGLKTTYSNYDPQAIDTLTADLISGKELATREHLYKVLMHDENVQKAYDMGKRDAFTDSSDKVQSVSVEGVVATPTESSIVRQEGESSKSVWRKIAANALKKAHTQNRITK